MSDIVSGDLLTRNYKSFRGVDFSNRKDEVSLYRSPDALNVWKNYKSSNGLCVETRPDIELVETFNNDIYGLFFYKVGSVEHMVVHSGTSLIDVVNGTQTTIKATGMKPARSYSFVNNGILYIKDGINYLEYNGTTLSNVADNATIPVTYIGCAPAGGGTQYQDHNLLSSKEQNWFIADGTSTQYYLNDTDITSVTRVWVNDTLKTVTTDYTVDLTNGKVTFTTAPAAPDTDGQSNVKIEYSKESQSHADRILGCQKLCQFDNRIFFYGNVNYPNYIFYSEFNGSLGYADARYISDQDYVADGGWESAIKAVVPGNNALWVFKEPSQANTTVFYHIPNDQYNENTEEYNRTYSSTHSSIATGCVSDGINFMDDIVFFSSRGLEGMKSTDVTSEQAISHRSTLVDNKLLEETNYKNVILQEYEGYLLAIIDKHIYLANSQESATNNDHSEPEWYYWEFANNITASATKDNVLYLCCDKKIYSLTNTSPSITSYWTTLLDEFGYPQYRKTTNKKGCVIDMEGNITISVKTDNGNYELLKDYTNTKGFVVPKIKEKKWKAISLKMSSNSKFSLYSMTLEAYVGGYVKR